MPDLDPTFTDEQAERIRAAQERVAPTEREAFIAVLGALTDLQAEAAARARSIGGVTNEAKWIADALEPIAELTRKARRARLTQ